MTRWLRTAFLFLAALACSHPVHAHAPHAPVVLVLISGTSLGEWRDATASPTLQHLLKSGSLAVMNVRTARSASEDVGPSALAAAVSLTAGARCTGDVNSVRLERASSPSPFGVGTMRDILQRRTGIIAPKSSLVDISWSLLNYENSKLGYTASPGCLVSALRKVGVPTYASGGSNAFIAALGDGYVVRGTPIAAVNSLPPNTFWIVDLGSSLKNVESPLSRIVTKIDAAHGTLILVSLYTNPSDYKEGWRLTPLLIYGPDWPSGLLYSPSTHTAGLATMADISPTVAQCFRAPNSVFLYGRPLVGGKPKWYEKSPDTIEYVANQQRSAMRQLPAMAVVLGLILLILALLYPRWPLSTDMLFGVLFFLLALVIAPSVPTAAGICVVFLILKLFTISKYGKAIEKNNSRLKPEKWFIASIPACTLFLIATSFVDNSWLMHLSLVGYSIIEGARYYGIGNEAMGILFGSALLTSLMLCKLYDRKFTWPLTLLFLILVLILGLPSAGAKIGGVLVGVGTFGAYWLRWTGKTIKLAEVASIAALTVAVLVILLIVDHHGGSGHSSHLAQLWDNTANGQTSDLLDTMLRKGKVELRLLYHSCWTVALIGGFAAVWRTWKKPKDRASQAFQAGSLAAIALTLLLNDAGVVACSLMLPYLAVGGVIMNSMPGEPDAMGTSGSVA